jgi:hypothetical protein
MNQFVRSHRVLLASGFREVFLERKGFNFSIFSMWPQHVAAPFFSSTPAAAASRKEMED